MASLLLKKVADKSESGEPPYPLVHVKLLGPVPDEHEFSGPFVDAAVEEGWCRFDGPALTYQIKPDPAVPALAGVETAERTLPGDRLTFTFMTDDGYAEVVYLIDRPPSPRDWRLMDDDASNAYRVRKAT